MLKFDGDVVRPQEEILEAGDLKTGELFVTAEDALKGVDACDIRMAVCYYAEGDDDVRHVLPFEHTLSGLDEYDELPYTSNSEPVRRIEITASEIKVL